MKCCLPLCRELCYPTQFYSLPVFYRLYVHACLQLQEERQQRFARLGQKRPVLISYVICEGSVDEQIAGDVEYDALTIEQGAEVEGRFARREDKPAPLHSPPELAIAG